MIVIQIRVRFGIFGRFRAIAAIFYPAAPAQWNVSIERAMTEFYCIYISVKQGFTRFPKFVTHMIYYINIYNFNYKKKAVRHFYWLKLRSGQSSGINDQMAITRFEETN